MIQWKNLSIRWKLGLAFGFCLALMIALGGFAYTSSMKLFTTIDRAAKDSIPGSVSAGKIDSLMRQIRLIEYRLLAVDKSYRKKAQAKLDETVDKLEAEWPVFEKTILTDVERQHYTELRADWDEYWGWHQKLLKALDEDPSKTVPMIEGPMLSCYFGKLLPALSEIVDESVDEAEGVVRMAEDNVASSRDKILILSISAIVGSLLVATLLARSILKPVGQLQDRFTKLEAVCISGLEKGLDKASTGDFTERLVPTTTPIDHASRDELGVMVSVFNRMLSKLKVAIGAYNSSMDNVSAMIATVSNSATEVGTMSQMLAAAGEESSAAANEIAMGSQNLAMNASDASGEMEGVAEQIVYVAKSAENQQLLVSQSIESLTEAATGIDEVKKSAEDMENLAENGNRAVSETVMAMSRLKDRAEYSTEKVRVLDEAGHKIDNIVKTIEAIAEQTNLLALNAAIEAARAGEHGRGFAVVAEEVRKLAEQAGASTKEIGSLVEGIRSTVEETVDAIQKTQEEVDEGSKSTEEAGRALSEIVNAAQAVASKTRTVNQMTAKATTMVESLSQEAAQNKESALRMEEGGRGVTTAIMKVAATGQQSSAGMQELNASIEEVGATATELAHMSEKLQALMNQFKTLQSEQKAKEMKVAA